MTDETQTPDDKPSVLAPEAFDLNAWLDGSIYEEKTIEVFNNQKLLGEIAELQEFVNEQAGTLDAKKRSLLSIGDDDEDTLAQLVEESEEKIKAILEALKGTGVVFTIRGMAPGERDMLEKKLQRSLKPKSAVYEGAGDDRIIVEPAVNGGAAHPEYSHQLSNVIVANSIVASQMPNGASRQGKWSVEEIENLRSRIGDVEWNRLANVAFDVNYISYNIDKFVSVDFS